jgi:hypothetical protein
MGYQPYLNDTDAAIASDEQSLMDYTHGYDGGYINQGYSNVAALPSQMQLAQMIELRSKLNDRSIEKRKLLANERSAMADEDEFQGFSDEVRGMAKLSPEKRAGAMQDLFLNNPSLMRNRDVVDATKGIFETDKWSLDARDNILKQERQSLEARLLENEANNIDDKIAYSNQVLENSMSQAKLAKDQTEAQIAQMDKGLFDQVGSFVASSGGFTEEEIAQRDKVIALTSSLANDPDSRGTLRGITQIVGSIALGNKLPDVYRAKMGKFQPVIRSIRQQTKGEVDFENLPEDPSARQTAIARAGEVVARSKNPTEVADFGRLVRSVAEFDRSKADVARTKADFFSKIDEINELRYSPDPAAKQKIADTLAVLNAKASIASGYYNNGLAQEQQDLARRKLETQIETELSMIKKRGADSAYKIAEMDRKAYADKIKTLSTIYRERNDMAGLFSKVAEDGGLEAFGLTSEAKLEDFVSALEKVSPPPGVSGRDLE